MLNRSALATSIYVGGLDGGSGTEENPRPTALISGTTMTMLKERVIQVEVLRMQVDVEPWSYICRSQHCHMWMRSDRLSQLDVASERPSMWPRNACPYSLEQPQQFTYRDSQRWRFNFRFSVRFTTNSRGKFNHPESRRESIVNHGKGKSKLNH